MSEVAGPIVAITAVLSCVFIPTAFIPGLTGSFYRQFALTIAFSTILSMVNSLTLSPAMCALFLQPPKTRKDFLARAPEDVVAEQRTRLADEQARRVRLVEALAALG